MTDDQTTYSVDGRGVVNAQDGGLVCRNDLDVTCEVDLYAFLLERSQERPAAGDAADGLADTIDSSQRTAADASWVPEGTIDTVGIIDSSQGGTIDASSLWAVRVETVVTWTCLKGERWMPPQSRQGGLKATRAHH